MRTITEGLKDGLRAARKQPPHMIPSVAESGEMGAMTSEDAKAGYLAIAGPTFRNEVTARALLYEGQNRPIAKMADLRCPILLLSADRETVASPGAAPAAAWKAKGLAEVREYDCAHFDIYLGEHRERADRRPDPLPAPPPHHTAGGGLRGGGVGRRGWRGAGRARRFPR